MVRKRELFLCGWIDLTSTQDSAIKKSIKYFDEALQGAKSSENIDASFGKAAYLVKKSNFTLALEFINKQNVFEKMKRQTRQAYLHNTQVLLIIQMFRLTLALWRGTVFTFGPDERTMSRMKGPLGPFFIFDSFFLEELLLFKIRLLYFIAGKYCLGSMDETVAKLVPVHCTSTLLLIVVNLCRVLGLRD
ncbi:uncharacterized protein LOC124456191 [Xenia sp. Carnegie-2017]|uniref:uncharacterized protein LOC124456191 n=1 Tax=Xenia sp. Carnegie-2017 TaxID=2897299 RepID=UPI001F03EF22|nr:uncharacterized protein LOC124456191 [Xenia sp. Carnegie-2017]